MGRVHAVTNVEEIVEEAMNTKLREDRWQEVTQDNANGKTAVSRAVLIGLAKNLTRQGRVSPGVGITAMQELWQ